jgi:hypothetical protein
MRDDLAVGAPGFLGEEPDERGAVGNLAAGLGQRLALLDRQQDGQLLGVGQDLVVPAQQRLSALGRRAGGPAAPGAVRGRDRLRYVGWLRAGNRGEHRAGRRIGYLQPRPACWRHPPAVDEELFPDQSGRPQLRRVLRYWPAVTADTDRRRRCLHNFPSTYYCRWCSSIELPFV